MLVVNSPMGDMDSFPLESAFDGPLDMIFIKHQRIAVRRNVSKRGGGGFGQEFGLNPQEVIVIIIVDVINLLYNIHPSAATSRSISFPPPLVSIS